VGISDRRTADLTLGVGPDGISVDTGSRFVPVGEGDLERILDRLASDGGTLRLVGGAGRSDDGDEPVDRDGDPAVMAASHVLGLAHARGLEVIRED
jgi:hypothetical protein